MPASPEPTSDPHVVADQSEVLAFLGDPNTHGLSAPVSRIDTHGAVVFLAGDLAYKVKRAVRFPFMDLSTLDRRKAACAAEVEVNRANAPGLYLGTVAITRSGRGLSLGGPGDVVEWAVVMRRFDERQTLDHIAARGDLPASLVVKLARAIAAAHARAPLRDGAAATASLARYIGENRDAFRETPALFPADRAADLTAAAGRTLEQTRDLLVARGSLGHVRRCHGDLHLRNIVLIDGEPTLFDAVEFDDAIATGDVLYDLAFLLMDLWEQERRASANLLLNRYLAESGDESHLSGLAAMPLFLSLRAAIRAKVVAASIPHLHGGKRDRAAGQVRRYFEVAEAFLKPAPVHLVAVGGLSGTGKSSLAARLGAHLGRAPGAVHLRSDIERKRAFGVAETERLGTDGYAPAATAEIYRRLRRKAALALDAGQSVVVDAVHARPEERAAIAAIAADRHVPFHGLWLEAPLATLVQRVEARSGDASDATAPVVRRQAEYDPGPIDWIRLDASGAPDRVVQEALRALGP